VVRHILWMFKTPPMNSAMPITMVPVAMLKRGIAVKCKFLYLWLLIVSLYLPSLIESNIIHSACSSTSQVLLCSELDHDATFSCADVATAVDTIDKYCTRQQTIWAPTYRVTQGQIFDTAGWNVVVRAKAGKC